MGNNKSRFSEGFHKVSSFLDKFTKTDDFRVAFLHKFKTCFSKDYLYPNSSSLLNLKFI